MSTAAKILFLTVTLTHLAPILLLLVVMSAIAYMVALAPSS